MLDAVDEVPHLALDALKLVFQAGEFPLQVPVAPSEAWVHAVERVEQWRPTGFVDTLNYAGSSLSLSNPDSYSAGDR